MEQAGHGLLACQAGTNSMPLNAMAPSSCWCSEPCNPRLNLLGTVQGGVTKTAVVWQPSGIANFVGNAHNELHRLI